VTFQIQPGSLVLLIEVPPGLLDGLPPEDQEAIQQIVGKPALLESYDGDGRAELRFTDANEQIHWIYVGINFIRPAE
jgi:hypothetical protein